MLRRKPTALEVRSYREANQCSLQDAMRDVTDQWRRDCLRDLRAKAGEALRADQCRDVVIDLLDLLLELNP